jgi:hypothetical protein
MIISLVHLYFLVPTSRIIDEKKERKKGERERERERK